MPHCRVGGFSPPQAKAAVRSTVQQAYLWQVKTSNQNAICNLSLSPLPLQQSVFWLNAEFFLIYYNMGKKEKPEQFENE